jgi:hypothetical protein
LAARRAHHLDLDLRESLVESVNDALLYFGEVRCVVNELAFLLGRCDQFGRAEFNLRDCTKNETAVKKDAAAKKKDEGQPKNKITSDADLSKAEGSEKAADSPGYSRGEGQKPVSKAY